MRALLIDTQILLWYQSGNPMLSATSTAALLDDANALFVSQASWWEMAIKISSKKLMASLPESMAYAAQRGIQTLDITSAHLLQVEILPFPHKDHRDPFDRLIIAQALVENVSVLSADDKFDFYAGIHRIA